jgi:hypothetical protein
VPRNLPKDADGNALRGTGADGSDLSKPMCANFQFAAPDDPYAKKLADVAGKIGCQVRVSESSGCALPWTPSLAAPPPPSLQCTVLHAPGDPS